MGTGIPIWIVAIFLSVYPSTFAESTNNLTSSPDTHKYESRNYYTRDIAKTKQLAFWETSLAAALRNLRDHKTLSNRCHLYVSKYLHEFDRDTDAVQRQSGVSVLRSEIVADNPILTFRLIHRLYILVSIDILKSCNEQKVNDDKQVTDVIHDTFKTINLNLPTQSDFETAMQGMIVIHYMYGFNATSELRFGIFKNVQTNTQLYFDDCVYLARKSMVTHAEAMAYQWLAAAKSRLLEEPPEIDDNNEVKLETTWQELMNLTGLKSKAELDKELLGKRQEIMDDYSEYFMYSGCRGENTLPSDLKNRLYCSYEGYMNPAFYINPVKMEVIVKNPPVLQFHDFMTSQDIQAIKSIYTNSATPSFDSFKKENYMEKSKEEQETIIQKLDRQIKGLLGFNWNKSDLEMVLNTRLSSFCNVHMLRRTADGSEEREDKLATVLLYLSDVKMGGLTSFYRMNTYAQPVKGSIVVFFSVLPDGRKFRRTAVYKECPVILGTNEWAQKWIY